MGLEVLDVAIGLVVVYLVLALVCTTVVEAIAQYRRERAKTLRDGVERLMGRHSRALFDRPEIRALSGDKTSTKALRSVPSYIPSETFSEACIAVVADYDPKKDGIERTFLQRLTLLEDEANDSDREVGFARHMRELWQRADHDRAKLAPLVAQSFNDAMQRIGSNYRRWAQKLTFVFGLLIVIAVNADTARMTRVLYDSPAARAQAVAQAEALVASHSGENAANKTEIESMKSAVAELRKLEPLLGWSKGTISTLTDTSGWERFGAWLTMIFGMLVSALAVSMGAPFWFKTLQSMLRARAKITGESSDAKADGAKKDGKAGDGAGDGQSDAAAKPAVKPDFSTAFSAADFSHSNGNGYWLGKFAELAYQTEAGFQSSIAGCKPESPAKLIDNGGTQVHVAEWKNFVIVAFRGTETNVEDFWTDAQFVLRDWSAGGKVHTGFHDALADVWDQLVAYLKSIGANTEKDGKTVWLTGHSLGGALAVLAASRLCHKNLTAVAGLYTIGQPRVGDADFVKGLDDVMGGRYFRYVNHRDVVPRVPARAMKYHHTGKVLYFNGDGVLEVESAGWTRWLDVAFGGNTELKVAVKESAGDHSATEYVERLRRALG
ncbi:MAG: lipase family protein [bacterium]|nr:lipase family protein [bacterium]